MIASAEGPSPGEVQSKDAYTQGGLHAEALAGELPHAGGGVVTRCTAKAGSKSSSKKVSQQQLHA